MHLIYLRLKTDSSVHHTPDAYVYALSCEWEICEQQLSLHRKLLSQLTTAPLSQYSLRPSVLYLFPAGKRLSDSV